MIDFFQNNISALIICIIAFFTACYFILFFLYKKRIIKKQEENTIQQEALSEKEKQIIQLEMYKEQALEKEKEYSHVKHELKKIEQDIFNLSQENGILKAERESYKEQKEEYRQRMTGLEQEVTHLQQALSISKTECATLATTLQAEQEQNKEKLALLSEAREQLSLQFKNLAGEILEEKAKHFAKNSHENLKVLLDPLKLQIGDFKKQVEDTYYKEGKERLELAAQVKQLMQLNTQLSDDANNLSSALKGQAKFQGNWGEIILERVLEVSGLHKGREYVVQQSYKREDGSRQQPDVIVYLPGEKHLVIDSKVSLMAYLDYVEAATDTEKDAALKRHLISVNQHVNSLSDKKYHALSGLESPDFVILFMPVEPAFILALSEDAELWQRAWRKNILLVSPGTLLFVIRTIAHIWQQEQQSQNARDIASRGASLYDKFAGFVDDLEKIGTRIRQTQQSYDAACTKLHKGAGNLIRQAEELRKLGVSPKKTLSHTMLEKEQANLENRERED